MMRYRRIKISGASHFFIVNLAERNSHLLVTHVDLLRASVRDVKTKHPFIIDAMVIMPNHVIRYDDDYENHIDYIHYNPVKHGFVSRPVDWAFSSIHRYIKLGILDKHWGSVAMDFADDIGYE
ncbi:MAG: hypothetical protein QX190_03100 [Methylococcales bacterium]